MFEHGEQAFLSSFIEDRISMRESYSPCQVCPESTGIIGKDRQTDGERGRT